MANEIFLTQRNEIYEWVVVAKDTEYWTNKDGDSCGEDFYRNDLTPFIIGDRAQVVATDEDGCEHTESWQQVLDRLTPLAIKQANQLWGEHNWTQFEFLEKVWHCQQYNNNLRGKDRPENLKSTYPIVEHRANRDWYAEQQEEKNKQLDAWFA
jgi:hypothetical protein